MVTDRGKTWDLGTNTIGRKQKTTTVPTATAQDTVQTILIIGAQLLYVL